MIGIRIKRLDDTLPVPAYAHPGDAGVDLYAREDVRLAPGERATVPTGIAVAIPEGYAGFVQPRSGLASRHGISIVNSPGLIDTGYRGEINVILINTDTTSTIELTRGSKIAQLVFVPVATATLIEVDELDMTSRGVGGFGSTGV